MEEYIFGRHVLEVVVENDKIGLEHVYIQQGLKDQLVQRLIDECKLQGIEISFVPRGKLNSMTNGNHQGVVAKAVTQDYIDLDGFIARAKKQPQAAVCVVDELNDPYNLGAIIRSAVAFKFSGIIIPKHRSVGITPGVMKASAGALSAIDVCRVSNISSTVQALKQNGFWIYCTDMDGEPLDKAVINFPLAVVMSSEHKGLREIIKEKCDVVLSIPMEKGPIDSLNVSVAAGIVFYNIHRARKI